ncbi:unnamed protein product, partial [marine sediment metagenome]
PIPLRLARPTAGTQAYETPHSYERKLIVFTA